MNVELHHPKDLQRLHYRSCKERNAKQRNRYRAVLLALASQSTETIMQTLDRSRNFVQRWVYAYRDDGIDAIYPRRQTGRPRKLTESEEVQLRERILAGPKLQDAVCSLRGEDARRIINEQLGVQYSLPGVYVLLHRLGLSYLVPRPRHKKNDPQKMRQWLKETLFCRKDPRRKTGQNNRDMAPG
ncbi:MAG: winged helix-turn-helix domain-containing protein [Planctomycetota bacterium]|jgi:transposase